MRVLLVEDHLPTARLIAENLAAMEQPAPEVHALASLQAALAALGSDTYDVVLLDLGLPDSQGLETLEAVRATSAQVPVVVLTGLDDPDAALGAMRKGADDFLVKRRLDTEDLARAARYAIERRRYLVRENELLTMLQHVGETVASELDTRRVVAVVAEQTLAATAATLCVAAYWAPCRAVARSDALERRITVVTPTSAGARDETEGVDGSPLFDSALHKSGRSRQLELLAELERVSGQPVADALVVPLRAKGERSTGALFLAHGRPTAMRSRDERIAAGIGAWANVALHNAQLFSERERAVSMRDRLLAIVSHDLRNPLGVISTATELIARSGDEAARRDFAQQIRRAVQRMERLVSDQLELAAIDGGSLRLTLAPLDVAGLLRDTCQGVAMTAAQREITIDCQFATELPRAPVDGMRLTRAFSNLIEDAVDATPTGGQVLVRLLCADDSLVVSVTDQGPTLGEEERAAMFDRLFTGKKSGRRATGLGLSISREIIRAHGGDISVESGASGGATLSVRVPLGGR
jgi:signal transduction histidine kinase